MATDNRWLLLVASLPTEDPAGRMRALRTLEALGAAALREGAYLLPESPANRDALERLAQYVSRGEGNAQVLYVTSTSADQQRMLRAQFDRSARYERLLRIIDSIKVGFGISDPGSLSRVLHKQRREFEAISALDFFPDAIHAQVRQALLDAEAEIRKLMFTAPAKGGLAKGQSLSRRTWVTRRPLWADRLASAWLVRRFIDPEGTVQWLEHGESLPEGAISFGYDGAHFANSPTRVTFEELVVQLDLGRNTALTRLARIVHALEVQGVTVPEAAGVETLLHGVVRRASNDAELLTEAEKAFDLLYDAFSDQKPS